MGFIKRRVVDARTEEKILIGMIASDSFCRDLAKLLKQKGIIETPYIQRVVGWCIDYHKRYKAAPGGTITDIFESEKKNLEAAEASAIEMVLSKANDEYQVQGFNEEYEKTRAFNFVRARSLKLANQESSALLAAGNLDEAEKAYQSYRQVKIDTSGWGNPFSEESVKQYFADERAQKDVLFKMAGAIGDFIGPFRRNWLVGLLAPVKRGKTFWLMEIAMQAVFAKRKTLFISLEMNQHRIRGRMYKRLTAMSLDTREYIFPVFDCRANQDGTCNRASRINSTRLLDPEGKKPQYSKDTKYRACAVCRGTKNFLPETWLTTNKVERTRMSSAVKTVRAQVDQFGENMRDKAYPANSVNLSRVYDDIKELIDEEDFVPDVVAIDYDGVLAPEDHRIIGRERADETWRMFKRISDELHCCVISASQSNRNSFEKKNVIQTDVSEEIRKIAHGDLWLAINQTQQEKRSSVVRISKIAMRDGEFDQYESAIVLQQLALGQVCLDSYLSSGGGIAQENIDLFI